MKKVLAKALGVQNMDVESKPSVPALAADRRSWVVSKSTTLEPEI